MRRSPLQQTIETVLRSRRRRGSGWPGRARANRRSSWAGLAALLIVAVLVYWQHRQREPGRAESSGPPRQAPVERGTQTHSTDGGIAELFRSRQSNRIVQAGGAVLKVLPDDTQTDDGSSRHQRFIVELPGGHTVLVAHNIDVSPRVPLRDGDRVEFRGEYEWNDKGGIVHWTHRDARGRHEDGWIRHAGRKYD